MSQKIVKWVAFPLFFFTVFFAVVYWNFPTRSLRETIKGQIQAYVSAKSDPRATRPAEVEMGEVSLWRLSGLNLGKVVVREAGTDEQPGTVWQFDDLRVRVGILSLLFGGRRFEFQADLYSGSASGAITLDAAKQVSSTHLEIANLDLKKIEGLAKRFKTPLGGVLTLDLDLDFGKNPAEDGAMSFSLEVQKFEIGGIFAGMNLGQLNADIRLENGKAKNQPIKLAGADVDSNAGLSVELSNDIWRSRVDATGWLKLTEAYLKRKPGYDRIFEGAIPSLRSAKEADGKYAFWLSGTLDRPRFDFGKGPGPTPNVRNNPLRSFPQ